MLQSAYNDRQRTVRIVMKKTLLLFSVLVCLCVSSQAQLMPCRAFVGLDTGGKSLDGLGHATYLPTAVKRLTDAPTSGVPMDPRATCATISVETQSIRFWTDGTSPTSSAGVLVAAGSIIKFRAEDGTKLRAFAFIEVVSGAKVSIDYGW